MKTINNKFLDYPILLKVKENLESPEHSKTPSKIIFLVFIDFLKFTKINNIHQLSLQHFHDYLIYLNSTYLNKLTINLID